MAGVLAENAEEVRLWGRDPGLVATFNERHQNEAYLPGITLSSKIRATVELEEALQGSDFVVMATPSQATREVVERAKRFIPRHCPIVTLTKGIENQTLLTMTELLEDSLPEEYHPYVAVLSGPSFAKEVAMKLPTAVTVAAHWEKVAQKCQAAFQTDFFRVYTSPDVIGVQMGGALKNVIAIAAGMSDGLGLGHNARSGIITRGLAEIGRIALKKGANPLTLSGLAGMGDLVLTCTGELSRNRKVGIELGKGRSLAQILGDMKQVAEGVRTAQSAKDLAEKCGVELPICHEVYAIAYQAKSPRAAAADLMARQPKPEAM